MKRIFPFLFTFLFLCLTGCSAAAENGYTQIDQETAKEMMAMDGTQFMWGIIIRMELLNPLSTKRMSEGDVVRLGIDISKALEFCNKSNIIHCDVKPSNIYTTKWGGYKLGDFSASTRIRNHQEHATAISLDPLSAWITTGFR